MTSFLCQKILYWGFGTLFIIFGGISSGLWPIIFSQNLRSQLVLSNDSRSFNLWKKTPFPMYIEFHMFHWTNPEETLNNNDVPNFIEKGPYIFSEEREKVNVVWNNNGTVTFKQMRKWVFKPELSNGLLSDKITNVNVMAMTIGNLIKKFVPSVPFLNSVVNEFIKTAEAKVYTTKTVGQLLFDGYEDRFLTLAKKLQNLIKIKLPIDKFGWFYNRNMSANYDGVFNMLTGETSLDDLGILKLWNQKSQTGYFKGECGLVEGTTGELWPQDSPHKAKAFVFATDLCSKIALDWDSETDILGASGSVFKGTSNVFDNGTTCYCTNGCHPSGVREISKCRFGAPAFISFPHFYLADPFYRTMVTGMEPSEEKHTFDLTLHKASGVPLGVNARLQINILVDKIPGLDFYKHIRRAYMPMLWFNEKADITPELAKELYEIEIFNYVEPCLFVLAGIGAVLIIVGLFLWTRKWKPAAVQKNLLLQDNQSS